MDTRTSEILADFAAGRIPPQIPDDCDYAEELKMLAAYLDECYRFAMDISGGDFSHNHVALKGRFAGSLKNLQANLKHLTWQTRQIAQGDLAMRIDFLGEFSSSFNSMAESLEHARNELLHMSTHDGLTGLHNRAYFDTEMDRIVKGRGYPVSIIVADVNGLKQANDVQGHGAGDKLLRQAAKVLRSTFRGEDVVARIGGDEFAVIMPKSSEPVALASVERIRRQIVEQQEENSIPLSLAIGVAEAATPDDLQNAFRLADKKMYEDKRRQKSLQDGATGL